VEIDVSNMDKTMEHGKFLSSTLVYTNKHGGTTRDVPQHVSVCLSSPSRHCESSMFGSADVVTACYMPMYGQCSVSAVWLTLYFDSNLIVYINVPTVK
jgi:hypothetical protein